MGRPKSAEEMAVINKQSEEALKGEALKKTHIKSIGDVECSHGGEDEPITPCDLHKHDKPTLVEKDPTCPKCKGLYDAGKEAWNALPPSKNARPTTKKEVERRGGRRLR